MKMLSLLTILVNLALFSFVSLKFDWNALINEYFVKLKKIRRRVENNLIVFDNEFGNTKKAISDEIQDDLNQIKNIKSM